MGFLYFFFTKSKRILKEWIYSVKLMYSVHKIGFYAAITIVLNSDFPKLSTKKQEQRITSPNRN